MVSFDEGQVWHRWRCEPTRVRVLQEYLDVAILRDLVELDEEEIAVPEGTIRVAPFWRWALPSA